MNKEEEVFDSEKFQELNTEDLEPNRVYIIKFMGKIALFRGEVIKLMAERNFIPKRIEARPLPKISEQDIFYVKREPTISMKEFGKSRRKR